MLLVLEDVSLSDVRRGGGSVVESISASYSVGILIYIGYLAPPYRLDFGQTMIYEVAGLLMQMQFVRRSLSRQLCDRFFPVFLDFCAAAGRTHLQFMVHADLNNTNKYL